MAKTAAAPKKRKPAPKPPRAKAPPVEDKPPAPSARDILLARNEARSRIESLATELVNACAQGLPVLPICAKIAKLSEVADG